MKKYKQILLALDLHPECDKNTAVRATELAQEYGASISVIHAIEHINAYGVAQAYPTVLNIEDEVGYARAKKGDSKSTSKKKDDVKKSSDK